MYKNQRSATVPVSHVYRARVEVKISDAAFKIKGVVSEAT